MHFLFQVSSVFQKQYLKKVMKIVLKELMNRAGLPTDNLICALTTYMGFDGSASVMLHRERAHHSNAGRLRAGSLLTVHGYLPQYLCLRKGLGYLRVLQQCVCFGIYMSSAITH